MSIHSGMSFSTLDEDNDSWSGVDCSDWMGQAGNWYRSCYVDGQNLNGLWYMSGNVNTDEYMKWLPFDKDDHLIKTSRMMFRSID